MKPIGEDRGHPVKRRDAMLRLDLFNEGRIELTIHQHSDRPREKMSERDVALDDEQQGRFADFLNYLRGLGREAVTIRITVEPSKLGSSPMSNWPKDSAPSIVRSALRDKELKIRFLNRNAWPGFPKSVWAEFYVSRERGRSVYDKTGLLKVHISPVQATLDGFASERRD